MIFKSASFPPSVLKQDLRVNSPLKQLCTENNGIWDYCSENSQIYEQIKSKHVFKLGLQYLFCCTTYKYLSMIRKNTTE